MLVIKCVYWLIYYDVLFGTNSIIFSKQFSNLGIANSIAYNLSGQSSSNAPLFYILLLLLLCVISFTKLRLHFIFDFIIWLLAVNIHNKLYATLSGGEFILNQFLFFNCFISDNFLKKESFAFQLKLTAHNFAVVAIIIQMCSIYLFSGLAKLSNDSWLNGSAVVMTMSVKHYSLPTIINNLNGFTTLFIVLNYLTIIYQLLFPFLVWIKKVKIPLLFIGIVMHLYIAFVIGLVTFGAIMILGYIYFWPEKVMVKLENG